MLRRFFCIFACALLLGSCSFHKETINPKGDIRTKTSSMRLDEAAAMIDEAEWWQAWLSQQSSIRRADAETILTRLDTICTGSSLNVLQSFMTDTTAWENGDAEIPLGNGTVSPTLYHTEVKLESAEIQETWTDYGSALGTYYEGTLIIRKVYTGTNEALASWEQSYIFHRLAEDGDWEFVGFSGYYNILCEDALPLSDAYSPTAYSLTES